MLTECCADKRGDTWALLARTLLSCVAEGAKLGPFLAKFHLSESTLANLLNLDNNLKPAWINIMVSGVTVSCLCCVTILNMKTNTFRNSQTAWRLGCRADFIRNIFYQ